MSQIRPIETEYNGYRFRSRLEARWAVFFDAMSIKYEYEPEGFEFDGTRYLPDFYLHGIDVFVEIKPNDESVVKFAGDGNKWEWKCSKFRDSIGKAILICYGDPAEPEYQYLFAWDVCDSGGGCYDNLATFKEFGGKAYLVTRDSRADRNIYINDKWCRSDYVITAWQWLHLDTRKVNRLLSSAAIDDADGRFAFSRSDKLDHAKKVARQARFEHGETPTKESVQGR